jgi:competence protein ComEC
MFYPRRFFTHGRGVYRRGFLCRSRFAAAAAAGFFLKPPARLRSCSYCPFLAAGFLWNALYAGLFVKPAAALGDSTASVAAVALGAPEETDYGYQLPVAVKTDGAPDIKTRLYGYGELPVIEAGDALEFTARFRLADTVYGEQTNAYFAKGIFLLAYADGDIAVTDAKTPAAYWPLCAADAAKQLARRIFPDDARDFMAALLLGDQSGVYTDPVLSSSLSAAGAAHVVAVSGMHLSFLVGFLKLLVKKKRRLAAAAIPLILLFMAVVGFRPSLVRAGVMQIFVLSAFLFNARATFSRRCPRR